jgi:hypothetical protein
MLIRAILPSWVADRHPTRPKVIEGDYQEQNIQNLNEKNYNIYYLPNHPAIYDPSRTVDGSDIDVFNYVFVDLDMKHGAYPDKESFIERLGQFSLLPSRIVDSGNGIHAYWRITDLDAMNYLKLQRRLCRELNTDEAVSKIYQLMRLPGYYNTKEENAFKMCELLLEDEATYTCEQMDRALPPITVEDEAYCKTHFDKTYEIAQEVEVDERLPAKFGQLLSTNSEVKKLWSGIWTGDIDDRSKADYRLGHLMFASGFTKDEAMSVLVNTAKSLDRAPKHRIGYASNIVEKIWVYEEKKDEGLPFLMSSTVKDILSKSGGALKGKRFPCYKWLDNTAHGFRLGQVIGLVAGSGVGKTAIALNMFMGFVESNPDYEHFFIPLEQPANEIADRWKVMCGEREDLHSKVHIISNYADDGSYRHLSLSEIEEYLVQFQKLTGKKIGAVVIDHIGALKKKGSSGENQDLMDICHSMKAFAIRTNTLLIMQSQTSREKAGIGDLELNKDAAYGTMYFEAYCDYLITIWQPLKRCYNNPKCPTVTAFKFCKIRHKKKGVDAIQEDVPYLLLFDPLNEKLRTLTQKEEQQVAFFNQQATNARKTDAKSNLVTYTVIKQTENPHESV